MNEFEYLSVLVSIIVGLALSHLLTGLGRIIQARRHIRVYPPTLGWIVLLFLLNVQVWWSTYEYRVEKEWTFLSFLLFLLIPALVYLQGALIVPDFEPDDSLDMRRTYFDNRVWYFGIGVLLVLVTFLREYVVTGEIEMDSDPVFRLGFLAILGSGALVRNERWHAALPLLVLAVFAGYVLTLFRVLL